MEDIVAVERVLGFKHGEHPSMLAMAECIQEGFPVKSRVHLQRVVAPGDKTFVHHSLRLVLLKNSRRRGAV